MNTPDTHQPDAKETLKEQQLWRIFFWSFFLSQGFASLQQNLFEYVREHNPQLRITHDDLEEMQSVFVKRLRAFIPKTLQEEGAHFAIALDSQIGASTNTVLGQVHNLFCEPGSRTDQNKLLTKILHQMLTRDRDFLMKKIHRPGKSTSHNQTFLTDPWLSHVEHFLVEGHSINVPEYDALFEELRPMAKRLLQDPKSKFTQDYKDMLSVRNANRVCAEHAQ